MIRHLRHNEIDRKKWDRCVTQSTFPSLYGLSEYLDVVSPGWEALVESDYIAVMPLTIKKKLGISYLPQPHFCQQTGVFGTEETVASDSFLKSIPEAFSLVEISLNTTNSCKDSSFEMSRHRNLVLQLQDSFRDGLRNSNENTKRNIKKAQSVFCVAMEEPVAIEEVISMFREGKEKSLKPLKQDFYDTLKRICDGGYSSFQTRRFTVRSSDGVLLGAAVVATALHRHYYLFSASTDTGKKTGAMHLLVDFVLRTVARDGDTFDFEGSDHPNLARFYSGFGAKETVYLRIRKNRLPRWVRWIKK